MIEFVGKFLNKIDKKGRISVPAFWRPKLLGKEFSGIVLEQYITDPSQEPDTSKWLTNIYYYVK